MIIHRLAIILNQAIIFQEMVFVSTINIFQGSVLMMTRAITRLLLGDCATAMAMTIITHEMVSPCWISQYIGMICHTGEMRGILYSLTEVSIADHQGSNEAIDGDGPQQLVTWNIFDRHSDGRVCSCIAENKAFVFVAWSNERIGLVSSTIYRNHQEPRIWDGTTMMSRNVMSVRFHPVGSLAVTFFFKRAGTNGTAPRIGQNDQNTLG